MHTIELRIENTKSNLMLVMVEPEASDYWLKPNESFTLVGEKKGMNPHFEIQHTNEGITVYPSSDCGFISPQNNKVELECGHNRPKGWN